MIITIVGLGVIGASYANVLAKSGNTLYGFDISTETIFKAKESGLIADGFSEECKEFEKVLLQTDLLILCIYPNSITDFIIKYKPFFKESLIITDVCGIKCKIIENTLKELPLGVDFVFAHPMAGREKRGIDYSSATIFNKANFIITKVPQNKDENINFIEKLALDMGFKNVMKITPEEHDVIISFISQLPHIIAVSLINSDNLEFETGKYTGDSYRELTRIANINEDLWTQLFLGNKENLLNHIDEFTNQLDIIKAALENDDEKTLRELFVKSSVRRQMLDN